MSGELLAHSAKPERGSPEQEYWKHVNAVARAAGWNARRAALYWKDDRAGFRDEIRAAALLHDCGKLGAENQRVLSGTTGERLPIPHWDAGAAWLLEIDRERGAVLVSSHHTGLPSMVAEKKRALQGQQKFRVAKAVESTARDCHAHRALYEAAGFPIEAGTGGAAWSGLTYRIGLSCLVDADHSDTAAHYGNAVAKRPARRRWSERLRALDRYVGELGESDRADERREVYRCCRDAEPDGRIVACDAAVGSGKTTAVMAHLLNVARRDSLRHIFVVLPFTNIIQQSAETYRKALTIDAETAAEVVAEVHHRAEFEDRELREMSTLWDAPVTVTTAVQFFETLAGNQPARLRKLHELAGSAIFLDEAHAAIPPVLWPQTWKWLKELTEDWGCYVVLGSGSLARFWENADVVNPPVAIPELLTEGVQSRLRTRESHRIEIRSRADAMDRGEAIRFMTARERPGPRLVIVNTVQSAAALAAGMRQERFDVEHLSTALTPADRERIIYRVRERLRNKADREWTLVATSCVEAGVDFSFRTAIRERCGVASLIQTGGRVNRHGDWGAGEVWDIRLAGSEFNCHPGFDASIRVFAEMWNEGLIGGDTSGCATEALRRELRLKDVGEKSAELEKQERLQDFPRVAELYRVIDAETFVVVVDREIIRRFKAREGVRWQELVSGSVQMWRNKLRKLAIEPLGGRDNLFQWNGPYDPEFLGYMKGVLPLIEGRDTGLYA